MHICLVTPHHVSFQPRTVREADALTENGHEVRVVSRQTDSTFACYDSKLMHGRTWKLQSVELKRNGNSYRTWLKESLRSKLWDQLFSLGLRTEAAASRAYVRGLSQTIALASAQRADLFIAHTQAALPIAAAAARRWNARLGFDCEDLLAQLGADPSDLVKAIEQKYVPRCDYVSVPSESIAERLVEQYGIKPPVVLYNVFPLKLAEGMIPPKERPVAGPVRLHWFGQTIGEGRGLEDAVDAAKTLGNEVELHLRGRLDERYRAHLELKGDGQIRFIFHPLVAHDELIKTMDQFDVGLALEDPRNEGYGRTVTNKLFSYLLAGLAIAATDTVGQREILGKAPQVGFLYPSGQPQVLAEGLRLWLDKREALRVAQQAAWDLARERFCWDIEKQKLFAAIRAT